MLAAQPPEAAAPCAVAPHAASARSRLKLARKADLVAYDLKNSVVVLEVCEANESCVTLKVTTATKDLLERLQCTTWSQWAFEGYKDASATQTVHVGLGTQPSSKRTWVEVLLSCPLATIPQDQRKRAGPKPAPEEFDFRPVWQPKVIVDGSTVDCQSLSYATVWPKDDSALSCRPLTLYFPCTAATAQAFPYWVESPTSSYRLSVLDSHRG